MARFDCENPDIRKPLEKLRDLIEGEGGILHPELTVSQRGNALSLSSTLAADDHSVLVELPTQCLIAIDDINLSIEDEAFVLESVSASLNDVQTRITELMFEVFNLTHKLAGHRSTCPPFCFAGEPKIAELIRTTRNSRNDYWEQIDAAASNRALIKSFLKTRTISIGANEGEEEQSRPSLMPFIDYVNHHINAPSFGRRQPISRSSPLVLYNAKPVAESNECYAAYQRFSEVMDCYIGYHFFDIHDRSRYVRSIPLRLELEGLGILELSSTVSQPYKGKLAPRNEDLRPWMPRMMLRRERHLVASHILIPGSMAPRALCRALGIMIRSMKPGTRGAELVDAVNYAEQEILRRNTAHFEQIIAATQKPESPDTPRQALEDLAAASRLELERIRHYIAESEKIRQAGQF